MSYTTEAQLELIPTGQADWDTSFNANMKILDQGLHVIVTPATSVQTGTVCTRLPTGYVAPFNPSSPGFMPSFISPTFCFSGESKKMLALGTMRNIEVWSGYIRIGEPVFSSGSGTVVSSFAGHGTCIGVALSPDSILFQPNHYPVLPATFNDALTNAASASAAVNSFGAQITGLDSRVTSLESVGGAAVTSLQAWTSSLQNQATSNDAVVSSLSSQVSGNVTAISSLQIWEAGLTVGASPSSGEVLLRYAFPRPVRFRSNFSGWRASVGIAPTSGYTMTVKKNSNDAGTIFLPPAGLGDVGSFTTVSSLVDFGAGDVLTIEGQSMTDLTLSNFSITLFGDRR